MIPIRTNILFKPAPSDEKSEGGLYVPDSFKQPSNKGTVVSVGSLCKKLKAGQVGFRVKSWGQEVLINDELHFLMDESAIIAVQ